MYTKGEWEVNKVTDFNQNELFAIHTYIDNRIQRVADVWIEANAHLISAAPDLYEALTELLHRYRLWVNVIDQAVVNNAKEALAKAEGK